MPTRGQDSADFSNLVLPALRVRDGDPRAIDSPTDCLAMCILRQLVSSRLQADEDVRHGTPWRWCACAAWRLSGRRYRTRKYGRYHQKSALQTLNVALVERRDLVSSMRSEYQNPVQPPERRTRQWLPSGLLIESASAAERSRLLLAYLSSGPTNP